jgi:hypothetical protein
MATSSECCLATSVGAWLRRPLAALADAVDADDHDRNAHRGLHVGREHIEVEGAAQGEGEGADGSSADAMPETPESPCVERDPPSPSHAEREQRGKVVRARDGMKAACKGATNGGSDYVATDGHVQIVQPRAAAATAEHMTALATHGESAAAAAAAAATAPVAAHNGA